MAERSSAEGYLSSHSNAPTGEVVASAEGRAKALRAEILDIQSLLSKNRSELARLSTQVAAMRSDGASSSHRSPCVPAGKRGAGPDAVARRNLPSTCSEVLHRDAALRADLSKHEHELARGRQALVASAAERGVAEPQRGALLVAWKRAVAEHEELRRQARLRRCERAAEIRGRAESQVVLTHLDRKAAVEALSGAEAAAQLRKERIHTEFSSLVKALDASNTAMERFRRDFEQLRAALMLDRMGKAAELRELETVRDCLREDSGTIEELVIARRQKTAELAVARWEDALRVEQEAGRKRLKDEQEVIEKKFGLVAGTLRERYEAGFQPVLDDEESKHARELARVVALKDRLAEREHQLHDLHSAARRRAHSSPSPVALPMASVSKESLRKTSSFDELVAELSLVVDNFTLASFLQVCDASAPFHGSALRVYQAELGSEKVCT